MQFVGILHHLSADDDLIGSSCTLFWWFFFWPQKLFVFGYFNFLKRKEKPALGKDDKLLFLNFYYFWTLSASTRLWDLNYATPSSLVTVVVVSFRWKKQRLLLAASLWWLLEEVTTDTIIVVALVAVFLPSWLSDINWPVGRCWEREFVASVRAPRVDVVVPPTTFIALEDFWKCSGNPRSSMRSSCFDPAL